MIELYIIIMKPFIELAGENCLPAICYISEGETVIFRESEAARESEPAEQSVNSGTGSNHSARYD